MRCFPQPLRLGFHEVSEILEQHLSFPKKIHQAIGESDAAQGSTEDESIKTAQNSTDTIGMACYKGLHGVLLQMEGSA